MDRNQRHQRRRAVAEEASRSLQRAMDKAGIPKDDRDAFLHWATGSLWKTFKDERMNERIIIENEIRQSGLRLGNGTVNKPYSATISLPAGRVSDVRLDGAEELGLILEDTGDGKYIIEGKPHTPGDFTLTLRFNTVAGEPTSEIRIPIAFNPDPRSLWKDIATDKDIPYYKPDKETRYIKVESGADGEPRKDIAAASVRGRSHAQEGKPRDDHFSIFHCDASDWYIMAVADGAGSARYSRKGAEVACKTVEEHCRERLTDNPDFEKAIRAFEADQDNKEKRTDVTRQVIDIILNGARKAHDAIKKVAQNHDGSILKDYATTLMFAICKKFDFGWYIASFWVGDGAMGLYDEESGTIKLLGTPDEGEYSGQTRFLTMPEIFQDPNGGVGRLRMTFAKDFTALFLMSDGVSDPMFETDRNLNDFDKWKEFYDRLRKGFPEDEIGGVDLSDDNEEAANQLLGWLDFWSPGNHDDRTIAILY